MENIKSIGQERKNWVIRLCQWNSAVAALSFRFNKFPWLGLRTLVVVFTERKPFERCYLKVGPMVPTAPKGNPSEIGWGLPFAVMSYWKAVDLRDGLNGYCARNYFPTNFGQWPRLLETGWFWVRSLDFQLFTPRNRDESATHYPIADGVGKKMHRINWSRWFLIWIKFQLILHHIACWLELLQTNFKVLSIQFHSLVNLKMVTGCPYDRHELSHQSKEIGTSGLSTLMVTIKTFKAKERN